MDIITKQKTYFWLITILVIINLVTLYFMWAHRPAPPGMNPPDNAGAKGFLFQELALDSAQQKLFDDYRDEHFKSTDSLFMQIEEAKREITEESLLGNPDREKIEKLASKIGSLNAAVELSLFDHFAKLKKVLNEEQLKKFKEILSESIKKGMPGDRANIPPPGGPMRKDFPPRKESAPPPPIR